MNGPVLCCSEPGRLFRRFLAWPLVAVVGFGSGDVRGEDAQTRFALADEGLPSTEVIPQAVGREIEAGLFPGVVLLIGRPGRGLYHEAFGHARIVPEKVPMQKDCIFDLASVTKVVAAATAFGVCVDDGSLRFNMPIRQGLPDLSGSGIDPITVDQTATHTSGFDNTKYHGQEDSVFGGEDVALGDPEFLTCKAFEDEATVRIVGGLPGYMGDDDISAKCLPRGLCLYAWTVEGGKQCA